MSDFHIDLPQGIQDILVTLQKAGFQAYLVGGCVRDALMGKTPKDFDIATSATPEQVQDLFENTYPVGIKHGTVLVKEKDSQAEVTTFRKESGYTDFRHPTEVEFIHNIEDDLARRDFTINAIAYSPKTGLVDPFHGQEDLKKGIIRAVGDPKKRFEEDALRMLRAFRFMGRYGFTMDEKTREAIEEKAPLVENLAAERVATELEEILKDSPAVLDQMTLLLKPWIFDLDNMLHTPQKCIYHYTDVLHHTLDALKAMPYYDQSIAWALLLHDIGKVYAHQYYDNSDHFKGHPEVSARMAFEILSKLKLPKKTIEEVPKLVALHDTFYSPKLENLYKLRVLKGFDDALVKKLFVVQACDISAHAKKDRYEPLEKFQTFYEREKNKHPFDRKDLAINGTTIQENTSLKGAQISACLDALLKEVIINPNLNSKEAQFNWMIKHQKDFESLPSFKKDRVSKEDE